MRKNLTDAEKKLWYELRDFKHSGHYFRRQVPIGNYIADFACLKAKLIVELDGGHHTMDAQWEYDKKRDAWLEAEGYKVIRFPNRDVFKNMRDVLEAISRALPLEGGGGRSGIAAKVGGGDALSTNEKPK